MSGRPEHSLIPHHPASNNTSFLSYPHPPLKVDVICVAPLMSAYVSEAVEKIPNKDQKDYRKRSSCVIVCIATTYQ